MNELYNCDIELWCDECVIHRSGDDSKPEYARVLIAMEELKMSTAIIPISTFGKNSVVEAKSLYLINRTHRNFEEEDKIQCVKLLSD